MNIRKIPKSMCAQAYKIGEFLSRELSAEIGDNLSKRWLDNAEKNDKLIKYWSILLARSIKIAQKETDLFPGRFFVVFQGSENF